MDDHKVIELLRQISSEVPGRTRFCPDDELITEYFEGTLAEQPRTRLKHHLVNCRFCLARVGNLERLAIEEDGHRVLATVLADAKGLARQAQPPRTRFSREWTVAAVIVLAISGITMLQPPSGDDLLAPEPPAQIVSDSPRQLRNIDPVALNPSIISPTDGASINPGDLSIKWTRVRGSLYYDVRVVDAEGFIISSDRVEDATEWKPRVSHLLEPGKAYYVRVDAYLAEANTMSSEHVQFTVEGHLP